MSEGTTEHDVVYDLLGAYALGTATPEEAAAVRAHLPGCPRCQRELLRLQRTTAALVLAVEPMSPSPALRQRLAHALEQRPAPARTTQPWWARPAIAWATAACLLVACLALLAWNLSLTRGASETFPIRTAEGKTIGMARYLRHEQVLILQFDQLPPAPADHIYQVWMIAAGSPIPAGSVPTPAARVALATDPHSVQQIALTVEPGPLGSPAPTTQPFAFVDLRPSYRNGG